MGKLAARKKRVKRTESIGNVAPEAEEQVDALDGRIEAIQMLIPLGLQAVTEELRRAVVELAGPRYQRKESDPPLRRWGSQRGSVYLADQKLPVEVPRVRNVASATEVPLRAYQALQRPRQMDEGLLLRMLKGHRHPQLRGLRRDRTGGLRSVPFLGVSSLREGHGSKAGPIPGALPGRI